MMKTIVLLFLVLLSHSSALPCFPGTFSLSPSKPCKPCPKGTYQFLPAISPIRCTKCPAGSYLPFRGGRGKDICHKCPANTFSTTPGAKSVTTCKNCPVGMISKPGSASCVEPCAACQERRRNGCFDCSNLIINSVCSRFPLPRSDPCTGPPSCPPGFELRLGQCRKCHSTISPEGEACRSCPSGLVADKNRTSCIPCPNGYAWRYTTCAKCSAGKNTNGSRPLCVNDGTPCPSNFFEDPDGNCDTCVPGERYVKKRNLCVKCAVNETSLGRLSRRCEKCGPNERGGSRCNCLPGHLRNHQGVCEPCPAGTFAGWRTCVECGIGFFSKTTSTECRPCPPGTVQPERGQSSCKTCTSGLIPSTLFGDEYPSLKSTRTRSHFFSSDVITRSDCVDPRTNCPPHLRRVMDGGGLFYCEPSDNCPPGSLMKIVKTFGMFRGRARACIKCPKGTIARGSLCSTCSQEEIDAGKTSCDKCHTYENMVNGRCTCALPGFMGVFRNARGDCVRCPLRTATSTVHEVSSCAKCARGYISSRTGSVLCGTCNPGRVEIDRVRCEKCPEGFTSFGVGDAECVKIGGNS